MEPVEDRPARDTGVGQDGAQAGAAVGEGGQLGVAGPAHGVEGAPDQRRDVGAALGHGAEHLPASVGCLGVTDAHLQVPFALMAAADERRIQAEGDRRCWRRHWPDRGRVAQSLAGLERVAAQGLVARPGRDRQQVGQHAGGDAVTGRGAWANIKPMPRRVNIPAFSAWLYRYRNLVDIDQAWRLEVVPSAWTVWRPS